MIRPFELQKFLAGAKVMTRDGRPVHQLTYFERPEERYPLHGIVDGVQSVITWTKEGKFKALADTADTCNTDLVIYDDDCEIVHKPAELAGIKPMTLDAAVKLYRVDNEVKGNVSTFVAFMNGIHAAETYHRIISN